MFIDSHCHLHLLDLKLLDQDLAQIIQNSLEHKVNFMLSVATHPNEHTSLLNIAQTFNNVRISTGLHPEHAAELKTTKNILLDQILTFGTHNNIIAIGETGLDYFYQVPNGSNIDLATYQQLQRTAFIEQIAIAKNLHKPLIIHTRMAAYDTMQLLKQHQADQVGGIMHCFTENWTIAKQALDLGFYISFAGIITFKNKVDQILEVVRNTPLTSILLETDSPFLAPVPFRGKINQPCYIPYIANKVAEIKGLTVEEVALATTANFYKLFKLGSSA